MTGDQLRNKKIVVLTAGGPLPWIIVNAVVDRFGPVVVLEEEPESLRRLFGRRLKRLGAVTVAGQIGFGLLQRLIAGRSGGRRREIIEQFGLDERRPEGSCTFLKVDTVNGEACRDALRRLEPDVVLVVGTRMICKETLAAISAPILNYHAGINPKYRGMCGGYWALATGDRDNFGATVHLVDEGVDTGGILTWSRTAVTPADNFTTYPLLLAADGRAITVAALEAALSGRLDVKSRDLPSRQWYHPTLWGYLGTGFARQVW